MAYQALARKWRPQSFRDIIGQQTAVRTLQNAIEQKRIHHAYLFSGVRGVGKTTTARILAKALNCERGPAAEPCNECSACREITEGIDLDVREIDAATYSGADDVREIREANQFQPARDRYRIIIIDEVHSLSAQAWNALLKQIEEPPPHVIFMMATTERQKVPATILSRVQQFALRKITHDELRARLAEICEAEGIDADQAALDVVVRRGEGSVRDSLSLLDQIIAFSGRSFRASDVAAILGSSDASLFGPLTLAVEAGDATRVLELLEEAGEAGRDFKLLYRDFLAYLRTLLLIAGGAPESMISVSAGELESLRSVASRFEYTELLRILNLLIRDDELVSRTEQQRLAVEIALLKAAALPRLRKV
ncbi:MAG TPA: DNA polymerase III subunit gamma/tau, partial [Thermoanaerobaculia bacterium]|nr:DNA polymerase III subunit gamma/tau [Thermoanaerobaculia bacterium]